MTYNRDIHGGDMDLESCLGRHEVARSNLGDTEDRTEPLGHVTAVMAAPRAAPGLAAEPPHPGRQPRHE